MSTIYWQAYASGDYFGQYYNWSSNTVPGASDLAVIGHNASVFTKTLMSYGVAGLAIDAGANLRIRAGSSFTMAHGSEGDSINGIIVDYSGKLNSGGTIAGYGHIGLHSTSPGGSAQLIVTGAGLTLQDTMLLSLYSYGGAYTYVEGSTPGLQLYNAGHCTIIGSGYVGYNALDLRNGTDAVIYGEAAGHGDAGLLLGSPTITNRGVIEAGGGGAGSPDGIVISGAKVFNSGGTLWAGNSNLKLAATTIYGGTLFGGSSYFDVSGDEVLFDGRANAITISQATVHFSGILSVAGAITNNGVVQIPDGKSGNLLVLANTHLSGAGQIALSSDTSNLINAHATGIELFNDSTIAGAGAIGGYLSLYNQTKGVIEASSNGASLTIYSKGGASVISNGTLEAVNYGALIVQDTTISGSSGVILTDSISSVTLVHARVDASRAKNDGVINIQNASELDVSGTIANYGEIRLISAGSITTFAVQNAGASLTEGGKVTMSGSKCRIIGDSAGATLTNDYNTIVGTGFVGVGEMTLINGYAGVIDATGLLTVRDAAGHSLANSGLMEATGAGKLALVSETINQAGGGTILAADGLVTLQGVDFIGGALTTTGAGRINVDGGGATLDGSKSTVRVNGLLQVTGGQTLTVAGAVFNTGKLNLQSAEVLIAAAGATFSGKGQINLSNSSANIVVGATAGATLTNVNDRIAGSGLLGDGVMTLVNQAGGQIIGNQGVALTIDTGTNTIANAGLIENNGKGGTLVKSAIANAGTLEAVTAGTLTLAGTVTGAGVAVINGGTLYAQKAFAEKVTFTGSTGVLKLGASQAFTGKVVGLSKTGTNWLDLVDIGFFSTKTKVSYSGTTTSGTLTVTDGTHTAHITLTGDYTASTFTVANDGHGGTLVKDPATAGGASPLAQALAGFQHDPPPHLAGSPAYRLPRFPLLVARA